MATLNLTGGNYNFATITAGDTYPAADVRIEHAYVSTLTRVRIMFSPCSGGAPVLTLDSASTGITITNAATWEFTIDRIAAVPLAAGNYAYQMETTDSAGTVRTETRGTWQIITDLTP